MYDAAQKYLKTFDFHNEGVKATGNEGDHKILDKEAEFYRDCWKNHDLAKHEDWPNLSAVPKLKNRDATS